VTLAVEGTVSLGANEKPVGSSQIGKVVGVAENTLDLVDECLVQDTSGHKNEDKKPQEINWGATLTL
jgi:hypothetical protein